MYDLQKANMWKRISAALFDLILLVAVVIGVAYLLSSMLGYDTYADRLQALYDRYETEYNLSFDITSEEYNALSEADRNRYDEANEAFGQDEEAVYLYQMMYNHTLLIITFSILAAYLLLEFLVPLLLRNGQTLGKKVFGIGVMREDGVKLTPLLLFARTVLGKYTVETMIPVLILVMIYFEIMGIVGVVVILGLGILQLVLMIVNQARTPLHDKLAHTVTVDMASQMIFDSPEELLAYKKRIHAETVEEKRE